MIVLLLFVLPSTFAHVDNYIVGEPKVLCEESDLALDVVTAKPFRGNIFVKGRAKEPACRSSYATNSSNSYSLSLGNCGMQRLRSVNPRGVYFIITLIVSFHPSGFITKNDRAFHVKCFYTERDGIVTAAIKVSALSPTELSDELRMPSCEYSVRHDSINGPQIKFANVGETVFHVWKCSGIGMGMLVKKCFVTDGDGEQHAVIDFDGQCSTDSFLLDELTYDDSTMSAHARSHVFKYADSNQLYFTCQIELCHKDMGLCSGITPPNCSGHKTRRHRSIEMNRMERRLELDVSTPEMLIAGIDETTDEHSRTCTPTFLLVALSPFIALTILAACISIVTVLKKSSSKSTFCSQLLNFNPYAPN
ncbi:Cuticlin-1 [Toxocara canis]|uniref:Cuticlin-1 n=1 Tax=Toxocara canis TaxID=6265 RepID=A0A0B2UP17_TOXCA|nr:Cuticlin-1 [Toxocara canis]